MRQVCLATLVLLGSAVASGVATGQEPILYRWMKDEALLLGATNTTLILTNIQTADAGLYAAIATNTFGAVTSTVATLTVDAGPLIITQPDDTSVEPGGSATFLVTASGPALSYVWLHNDIPVADATNAT